MEKQKLKIEICPLCKHDIKDGVHKKGKKKTLCLRILTIGGGA